MQGTTILGGGDWLVVAMSTFGLEKNLRNLNILEGKAMTMIMAMPMVDVNNTHPIHLK